MRREEPSRGRRIVVWSAVLFACWHVFATVIWVGPSNSIARDLVPKSVLSGYMSPMFTQSWSVFAPSPVSADYILEVKAAYEENGERTGTDWIDATSAEHMLRYHNPAPGRSSEVGLRLAREYRNAYFDLSKDQREIVVKSYYEGDDSWDRLLSALEDAGSSRDAQRYIAVDKKASAYSTQVAYSVWGERELKAIQFKISRHPVVPFEDRNNPEAKRPSPSVVEPGWRGLIENSEQSRQRFAEIFIPALEEAEQRWH